jgi:hypothetical protein
VSALWNVTILRPLSTTQSSAHTPSGSRAHTTTTTTLQYKLFVTPVQDIDEALGFLKSLPRCVDTHTHPGAVTKNTLGNSSKRTHTHQKQRVVDIANAIISMCGAHTQEEQGGGPFRTGKEVRTSTQQPQPQAQVQTTHKVPTVTASVLAVSECSVQLGWCVSADNNVVATSTQAVTDTQHSMGAITVKDINRVALTHYQYRLTNFHKIESVTANARNHSHNTGRNRNSRDSNPRASRQSLKESTHTTHLPPTSAPIREVFLVCVDIKVYNSNNSIAYVNRQSVDGGGSMLNAGANTNTNSNLSTLLPYHWECVYRGCGSACAVTGLDPLCPYMFRIRFVRSSVVDVHSNSNDEQARDMQASASLEDVDMDCVDDASNDVDMAHAYVHTHTTNAPLPHGPQIISSFEPLTNANTTSSQAVDTKTQFGNTQARCKVQATRSSANMNLPPGCSYCIEGAINEDYDPFAGEENDFTSNFPTNKPGGSTKKQAQITSVRADALDTVDLNKLQWRVLAMGACLQQWIGGEICGKQLILSSSIMNQDGVKGTRSQSFTVVNVPEFGIV